MYLEADLVELNKHVKQFGPNVILLFQGWCPAVLEILGGTEEA
jgi:hypothetical protein